jgi:hypothetical protein
MTWSATSEIVGFLSGLAFVIPSWKANAVLKEVARLKQLAVTANNDFSRETAQALIQDFATNPLQWDKLDDICLKFGAGLLALSFLIKLILTLTSP